MSHTVSKWTLEEKKTTLPTTKGGGTQIECANTLISAYLLWCGGIKADLWV
jgi:hypothetical protein